MALSLSSTGSTNSSIRKLPPEVFVDVLSFLQPPDLACSTRVCRFWNRCVELEVQWKIQCQNLLDLSPETDPRSYVPDHSSYKVIFRALFAKAILGPYEYERYIGKLESVPQIPQGLSLQRWWDQPDPCDPTKTIGQNYVWMYIPSHIEIDSAGVVLSKADNPSEVEAPRLLQGGAGSQSVLKVPVTINNIKVLFERPKTGNPSTYRFIWDKIEEQHGNKRWAARWVCMKKDVIGRNLSFAAQQTLAGARGVVLSELLPRILFNCLGHVRSGTENIYPDGENPWVYARTSTMTHDAEGDAWPSGCGYGSPSGLRVDDGSILDGGDVGVAVVLPAEVQAIGP